MEPARSPTVLALDIGGANLKAAFLVATSAGCFQLSVRTRFLPLWKFGKEALNEGLNWVKSDMRFARGIDAVSITMTAELCDVFSSRREGVLHVLDCVDSAFPDVPRYALDVEGKLSSIEMARRYPLRLAAANWVATGRLASRFEKDCLVIDVGSTTTSIIPVADGRVAARGRNDMEKLVLGELAYSGALRTNVIAITNRIEIGGKILPCSAEYFANTGDVYLILGKISEEDYTTETADGRGKTRREALARLSRIVCADLETLSESEIVGMAEFIHRKQVSDIGAAVASVKRSLPRQDIPALLAGVGRHLIGEPAARIAGFSRLVDLGTLIGEDGANAAPASGLALMTADLLVGAG